MDWIAGRIKPVMLVSGLLTCTMFFAAFAPQAALRSTFGGTLEGPLAEVVVRSWGALIGLVGAMLIYGAYVPAVRPLVLVVAGASKLIFIGLVVWQGLGGRAVVTIVFDLGMVTLFAAYLAGRPGPAVAAAPARP